MKKVVLIAFVAMLCSTASAQLIKSSRVTVNRNHVSKIWLDLGAGGYTGDVEDTGVGVDLGLRWTQMFGGGIGWDILKVSAQTDTKSFSEALNVQLKTGLRYVTPVLFGNQSLYVNAGIGYGLFTDNTDAHGLAWEGGIGINITPRFSVGVAYNSQNYSLDDYYYYYGDGKNVNVGLVSLRLGIGL